MDEDPEYVQDAIADHRSSQQARIEESIARNQPKQTHADDIEERMARGLRRDSLRNATQDVTRLVAARARSGSRSGEASMRQESASVQPSSHSTESVKRYRYGNGYQGYSARYDPRRIDGAKQPTVLPKRDLPREEDHELLAQLDYFQALCDELTGKVHSLELQLVAQRGLDVARSRPRTAASSFRPADTANRGSLMGSCPLSPVLHDFAATRSSQHSFGLTSALSRSVPHLHHPQSVGLDGGGFATRSMRRPTSKRNVPPLPQPEPRSASSWGLTSGQGADADRHAQHPAGVATAPTSPIEKTGKGTKRAPGTIGVRSTAPQPLLSTIGRSQLREPEPVTVRSSRGHEGKQEFDGPSGSTEGEKAAQYGNAAGHQPPLSFRGLPALQATENTSDTVDSMLPQLTNWNGPPLRSRPATGWLGTAGPGGGVPLHQIADDIPLFRGTMEGAEPESTLDAQVRLGSMNETLKGIDGIMAQLGVLYLDKAKVQAATYQAAVRLQSLARGVLTRRRLKQFQMASMRLRKRHAFQIVAVVEDFFRYRADVGKITMVWEVQRSKRWIARVFREWFIQARKTVPRSKEMRRRAEEMAVRRETIQLRTIMTTWCKEATGRHSRKNVRARGKKRFEVAYESLKQRAAQWAQETGQKAPRVTGEQVREKLAEQAQVIMQGRMRLLAMRTVWGGLMKGVWQPYCERVHVARTHFRRKVCGELLDVWHTFAKRAVEGYGVQLRPPTRVQRFHNERIAVYHYQSSLVRRVLRGWFAYSHVHAAVNRKAAEQRDRWAKRVLKAWHMRVLWQIRLKEKTVEQWQAVRKRRMNRPFKAWATYMFQRISQRKAHQAIGDTLFRWKQRKHLHDLFKLWNYNIGIGKNDDMHSKADLMGAIQDGKAHAKGLERALDATKTTLQRVEEALKEETMQRRKLARELTLNDESIAKQKLALTLAEEEIIRLQAVIEAVRVVHPGTVKRVQAQHPGPGYEMQAVKADEDNAHAVMQSKTIREMATFISQSKISSEEAYLATYGRARPITAGPVDVRDTFAATAPAGLRDAGLSCTNSAKPLGTARNTASRMGDRVPSPVGKPRSPFRMASFRLDVDSPSRPFTASTVGSHTGLGLGLTAPAATTVFLPPPVHHLPPPYEQPPFSAVQAWVNQVVDTADSLETGSKPTGYQPPVSGMQSVSSTNGIMTAGLPRPGDTIEDTQWDYLLNVLRHQLPPARLMLLPPRRKDQEPQSGSTEASAESVREFNVAAWRRGGSPKGTPTVRTAPSRRQPPRRRVRSWSVDLGRLRRAVDTAVAVGYWNGERPEGSDAGTPRDDASETASELSSIPGAHSSVGGFEEDREMSAVAKAAARNERALLAESSDMLGKKRIAWVSGDDAIMLARLKSILSFAWGSLVAAGLQQDGTMGRDDVTASRPTSPSATYAASPSPVGSPTSLPSIEAGAGGGTSSRQRDLMRAATSANRSARIWEVLWRYVVCGTSFDLASSASGLRGPYAPPQRQLPTDIVGDPMAAAWLFPRPVAAPAPAEPKAPAAAEAEDTTQEVADKVDLFAPAAKPQLGKAAMLGSSTWGDFLSDISYHYPLHHPLLVSTEEKIQRRAAAVRRQQEAREAAVVHGPSGGAKLYHEVMPSRQRSAAEAKGGGKNLLAFLTGQDDDQVDANVQLEMLSKFMGTTKKSSDLL